jgi:3-phenylpropionate/cinnamic acid dioxygenase small subunit
VNVAERLGDLVRLEARLLDENKLDDWLKLYAEDATYWLPIDENVDPLRQSSIIYDDHQRLTMRVEQLMRQSRISQTPASLTMRMVSNLELDAGAADGPTARFLLLAMEARPGDWRQAGMNETRLFPARCELVANADCSLIRRKRIVLLNRFRPIEGLAFLL